MRKTLTFFEHEPAEFEWTDKDVAVLERLAQKTAAELLRADMRGGKKRLLATQHVGVFRFGNRTVQVLPKIYQAAETTNPSTRAKEARLNRRLEPLLNLARLFLDGGVMQLASRDLAAFAFVFDMNRVFEAFLVNTQNATVRNCFFRTQDDSIDIQAVGEPGRFRGLLYMLGDSPKHSVSRLLFENLTYFGRPVTQDSPCVQIGPHVADVVFRNGGP